MRIDSDAESELPVPYDWRRDGWLAACSLTAILLVISAFMRPGYGFETFLRIFVFCVALVRGFAGFRRGGAWLPLSAALIAILFNPARPVAMSSAAWVWFDLIAAAWFAIVGAWQLLRSWDPQRGWAAAALSLAALAVPAVAAMGTTDHEGLNPLNVDENLAEMNATSSALTAAPPATNATAQAAATAAAPSEATTPGEHSAAPPAHAPVAHAAANSPVLNAPAFDSKSRVSTDTLQQSAVPVVAPPPPSSTNDATSNNMAEGNQD